MKQARMMRLFGTSGNCLSVPKYQTNRLIEYFFFSMRLSVQCGRCCGSTRWR